MENFFTPAPFSITANCADYPRAASDNPNRVKCNK